MAEAKIYFISEVFQSIQGEGARVGTWCMFVRLCGCNLRCQLDSEGFTCDTQHSDVRLRLTAAELVFWVVSLAGDCREVIFTGGEPLLQLDADLVRAFTSAGFHVALETNGTLELPSCGVDYVACSPKRGHPVVLERADEVRVVIGEDGFMPQAIDLPIADNYYLSPAFDGDTVNHKALAHAVAEVSRNPQWKLSVQVHKLLKLA